MVSDHMIPARLTALQDAKDRSIYKAFEELTEMGVLEPVSSNPGKTGSPRRVYRFVTPRIDPASRVLVIVNGLVELIIKSSQPGVSSDEVIRILNDSHEFQHSAWVDICDVFGIKVENENGLIYAQHVPWSHATGGYREDQPPDPSDWRPKNSIRVSDFITKKEE